MKDRISNEGCRQQALMQASMGNHVLAARWYNTARARTIGHTKAWRYEQLADEQIRLAGLAVNNVGYAKDSEAIPAGDYR